MLTKKYWPVWIMAILIYFASTISAFADQNVYGNNFTNIAKNQTVENVIVIGNDAIIEGHVKDTVVVLNGDLTVKDSAQIQGIIVVLGGGIDIEQGAKITDNIFNLSFRQEILNNLLLSLSVIIGVWFIKGALSILLIFLFVLTATFAKNRLDPIEKYMNDSPKRVILVGIASSILITAVSLLLIISVVGIPFAILLLIVIFLFLIFGLATLSKVVGKYLLYRSSQNWRATFAGSFALVAAMNFPLLGGILILILIWMSIGIMTLWFIDWLKQKRKN